MSKIIKCFLLETTDRIKRELRRYVSYETHCPVGPFHYHNISNFLDIVEETNKEQDWDHNDPRWPKECACGYQFQENDPWQLFTSHLYKRSDTGEEFTLRDAPPGAIWHARWLDDVYKGPDGKVYAVKLPNGRTWTIDSRASNCTLPQDDEHKCWVRHGSPPNFTIDKNGHTCNAGAGSIVAGDWHGFLIDGELREC